jgi:sugar phosphate isomerase/epimerase
MFSCVTISLVPALAGGPWIYWDPLEQSLAKASAAGFDGVELFADDPDRIAGGTLRGLLDEHRLKLAAVGTGAGKVLHGWTVTDADAEIRRQARHYIRRMIDFGAPFGAPAIIGSMQGSVPKGADRARSLDWLTAELQELDRAAGDQGVPLIYEPLNRYETNLFNRVGDVAEFLAERQLKNVRILADLFHMNIEETSPAQTILDAGAAIGHVHFADSNRRPVGLGHIDMSPVADALKRIDYQGYVSAEALAYPDPDAAAAQTMKSYREWFA